MRFSASRRALLDQCAWPFRPEVQPPPDASGPAAILGTFVHALCEHAIRAADTPAPIPTAPQSLSLSEISRAHAMFAQWRLWFYPWLTANGIATHHAEVPFAYDPRSGVARILVTNGHRDYCGARDDEVCGTADFLGRRDDGRVFIRDWKSGSSRTTAEPQLRTLALMAARFYGVSEVDVAAVFLSPDSRPKEVGLILDSLDIDTDSDSLAARLGAVAESELSIGPACRYCPCRMICPAHLADGDMSGPYTQQSNALAPLDAAAPMTIEQVARAHVAIKIASDKIDSAKRRIRAEVERLGTVPIGGGKALMIVNAHRENLSKASITKALGDDAGSLLDKLRACGALTVSRFDKLEEINERKILG